MYRQLNYNGNQLQYECCGHGAGLVLLHGFAEDSTVWRFQKVALEQHFQLLIPNLPGTGGSDLLPNLSMELMADAVHAMVQQERLTNYVVIGHSMGGYVALAYAEKYGSELRGLGLFQSTAFADTDEKKIQRQRGIEFMQEHSTMAFLKTALPKLYQATNESSTALVNEQLKAAHTTTKESLIQYYKAMMQRPDRTTVLKEAAMPVSLVLGRHDTAVPLQDGLDQASLPQTSYVQLLEHSGHMGMLEEPERSNQLLFEFLSEIAAPA